MRTYVTPAQLGEGEGMALSFNGRGVAVTVWLTCEEFLAFSEQVKAVWPALGYYPTPEEAVRAAQDG